MKCMLGLTMILVAASAGCVLDTTDPESLGSTSLEVKTLTDVTGVIYFVSPGTQTIVDNVLHLRDRTVLMHLSDPTGDFDGEMELLHNFDLDLTTGYGFAYGDVVEMNVAAGTFAGDYSQDIFPDGVEGEIQADATTEPRDRHVSGHGGNRDTGSPFIYVTTVAYTHPAEPDL